MNINPSLCCYYSTYVLEKHMSNSFKTIECIVVKWFSKLWGEHMQGWLTNTHYDATMQIIQIVCNACKACKARFVFICSDEIEEEYKCFVSLLNIKIVIIPTDQYGEIDYNIMSIMISLYCNSKMFIFLNIGSNKGAIDDVDKVYEILKSLKLNREQYFIHCEAPMFGMMLGLSTYFINRPFINSISCAPHMFLGINVPCGIACICYETCETCNIFRTPLNGHIPLAIWERIMEKNIDVLSEEARQCLLNTKLCCEMLKIVHIPHYNSTNSNIIVLHLKDEYISLAKKWRLCKISDDNYKITIMQHVNIDVIDRLYADIMSLNIL